MKIVQNIKVPTGNILIGDGEKGKLEFLSLGDYGKEVNVKSDFLGLTRDIEKVVHTNLLPLEDKWVITISTQYGCSMGCKFCDVPKVGPGINATHNDLVNQFKCARSIHPEVTTSKHLNVHFARMGEPTFNPNVLSAVEYMWRMRDRYNVHPVVSTMMPKNNEWLQVFLARWLYVKNEIYNGNAGLQLSINSTSEEQRNKMFNNNCLSLKRIGEIFDTLLYNMGLRSRKIALNFAIADYEIDPKVLRKYFDPDYFMIKLTPMHKTNEAIKNGIKTEGDYTTYYPYQKLEQELKDVGFDVLVFIASQEEDLGRITCGNAILSGTVPDCEYKNI